MTLPRSAELRWQQETIERWLITRSVPFDAREGLLELLKRVNEEMKNLESARSSSHQYSTRDAS
jgi:succinate dehydrogenase/fumarate reductase-like Fe-S protein